MKKPNSQVPAKKISSQARRKTKRRYASEMGDGDMKPIED